MSFAMDCRSCFQGIQKSLKSLLDYHVSIGHISNTLKSSVNVVQGIHETEDLSAVTLGANDELFQYNKPVLAGVDIPSLYCYLLSREDHRDGDTWAIQLWDLQEKGFNPERIIADNGEGLRAGHQLALPNIPCDIDNFHMSRILMELRRYFRNCLKSAITARNELDAKIEKSENKQRPHGYTMELEEAQQQGTSMKYLSQTIDTLISWLEHDVFNKAGANPEIRLELYDFIVDEFSRLAQQHPHRIQSVVTSLKSQRDGLLEFVNVLNDKFEKIAEKHHCSIETAWAICELLRCQFDGSEYAIRSLPLIDKLGDKLDPIEDDVIAAMKSTERTSSMVENYNSRLRPYFTLRKEIGYGYLNLLRFYLNHVPFVRSENPKRKGKSPAELLTGKPHPHWLEMLGFKLFKRKRQLIPTFSYDLK